MTTNILEAIKQAYSAGLTDGARQAEVIARIHNEYGQGTQISPVSFKDAGIPVVANGARRRQTSVAKGSVAASKALEAQTASTKERKARGARKSAGPRTKGVKTAILDMIKDSATSISTAEIIAKTGFKATSVRATLMGLKTSGLVVQGSEGSWCVSPTHDNSGNSEGESASTL